MMNSGDRKGNNEPIPAWFPYWARGQRPPAQLTQTSSQPPARPGSTTQTQGTASRPQVPATTRPQGPGRVTGQAPPASTTASSQPNVTGRVDSQPRPPQRQSPISTTTTQQQTKPAPPVSTLPPPLQRPTSEPKPITTQPLVTPPPLPTPEPQPPTIEAKLQPVKETIASLLPPTPQTKPEPQPTTVEKIQPVKEYQPQQPERKTTGLDEAPKSLDQTFPLLPQRQPSKQSTTETIKTPLIPTEGGQAEVVQSREDRRHKPEAEAPESKKPMPMQEKMKQVVEDEGMPSASLPKTTVLSSVTGTAGKQQKTEVEVVHKEKHEKHHQEKSPEETSHRHKDVREGALKHLHKPGDGLHAPLGEESDVRVITLAGENKGATMEIKHGDKPKESAVHINRGRKLHEEAKDEEGEEHHHHHGISEERKLPFTTYINNNIQSINNSILYHSSCSNHNPGVHLSITTKEEKITEAKKTSPMEIHKSQTQVSEPQVQRRCLRGLFAELSDSDQENLEKPRRHGCRFST